MFRLIYLLLEAIFITFFLIACAFTGCAISDEIGPIFHEEYHFEKIIRHTADDYEYERSIFDCSDFSEELYNRLEYAGHDVRIESGCRTVNETSNIDFNSCHAWVVLILGNEEIYIESTTGEIKTESYYREKYPVWNDILKSTG